MERRLAAILAADVVGYSRLVGEGEEGTHRTLGACREVIDGLVTGHRGRVFSSAGEASLPSSPAPSKRCVVQPTSSVTSNAELPACPRIAGCGFASASTSAT